ncbi:archaetidylinositol phosphate synthase [Sulfuracidifex tepidarius]|uniref:Archaetidylinositol phosphate synthase n=1 Tax=Sulfuracidifex tepidarius TaxID=1294262 RepID=A0A510DVB1_9CREN|nr:archaetidylinositol phosphate synthase [Sulfuracidifex tepidarius]BBG23980.1 Archaetidylinositol phosphate synthase [Sulfuracidifex tepidarius]BBG26735.1 Archaetidylinositol phosphate synthase [Sulfuracidifex tepidarius]
MVSLITKLRKQSKKILTPVAKSIAKSNVSANSITVTGLALSGVYALLLFLTRNPLLGILIIAISSFMDALDGEVARVKGETSNFGAFLDSSFDRIEDIFFISPLIFLGFNPFLVSTLVGFSLTISYLRSKAELVGIKMEGKGIIERGERIIFIVVILLAFFLDHFAGLMVFYILYFLSIVTVVQRFYAVATSKDKL